MAKKEKKKDVKSIAKSSGNVKITVYKGDRKHRVIDTHNSGSLDLCNYVCGALVGDYVIAERPGIIIPCEKNSSGELKNIGLGTANEGYTLNGTDEETYSASCTLSFLIPSTLLKPGTEIWGFKLYSIGSLRKEYATIELLDGEEIRVDKETNLLVDWTLVISYEWLMEG